MQRLFYEFHREVIPYFDLNQSPSYIFITDKIYFTSCRLQFGVRLKMALPVLPERTEDDLSCAM